MLNEVCSIDEKRLATVVEEIKAAGGDALGIAGDVGADDFPKKIVDATVQYVATAIRFLHDVLTCSQYVWED